MFGMLRDHKVTCRRHEWLCETGSKFGEVLQDCMRESQEGHRAPLEGDPRPAVRVDCPGGGRWRGEAPVPPLPQVSGANAKGYMKFRPRGGCLGTFTEEDAEAAEGGRQGDGAANGGGPRPPGRLSRVYVSKIRDMMAGVTLSDDCDDNLGTHSGEKGQSGAVDGKVRVYQAAEGV
eukprot:scaffold76819_cov19-Tisochrysis_lutea.AAC.2